MALLTAFWKYPEIFFQTKAKDTLYENKKKSSAKRSETGGRFTNFYIGFELGRIF